MQEADTNIAENFLRRVFRQLRRPSRARARECHFATKFFFILSVALFPRAISRSFRELGGATFARREWCVRVDGGTTLFVVRPSAAVTSIVGDAAAYRGPAATAHHVPITRADNRRSRERRISGILFRVHTHTLPCSSDTLRFRAG